MVKSIPVKCTPEEIEAIINKSMDNEYYYTLFMVARTTGRRIGELHELKVSDIDFEKGVMNCKVLKRRMRVVKEAILRPDVVQLLKRFILFNKFKEDDYIFKQVTKRQVQNAVRKYAKEAGVTHPVTFHNFRHYFVTELIKKGWHYEQIIKLTGHGSPSVLVHYDHVVAADVKEKALEDIKDI